MLKSFFDTFEFSLYTIHALQKKERLMKKSSILLMLAPLMLVACGGGDTKPEPTTSDDTSVAPTGYKYTATIKNSLGNAIEGMKAQWCDMDTGICLTPVACDENGYAEIYTENQANYYVHAMSFNKKELTYNPYGHVATPANPDVEITMTEVYLDETDNADCSESNPLQMVDGAYRASLKQDEKFYCVYNTSIKSTLSFESWQGDTNVELKVECTRAYEDGQPMADFKANGVTDENGNFKYEFETSGKEQSFSFTITLVKNPYNATGSAYAFPFAMVKKA